MKMLKLYTSYSRNTCLRLHTNNVDKQDKLMYDVLVERPDLVGKFRRNNHQIFTTDLGVFWDLATLLKFGDNLEEATIKIPDELVESTETERLANSSVQQHLRYGGLPSKSQVRVLTIKLADHSLIKNWLRTIRGRVLFSTQQLESGELVVGFASKTITDEDVTMLSMVSENFVLCDEVPGIRIPTRYELGAPECIHRRIMHNNGHWQGNEASRVVI